MPLDYAGSFRVNVSCDDDLRRQETCSGKGHYFRDRQGLVDLVAVTCELSARRIRCACGEQNQDHAAFFLAAHLFFIPSLIRLRAAADK